MNINGPDVELPSVDHMHEALETMHGHGSTSHKRNPAKQLFPRLSGDILPPNVTQFFEFTAHRHRHGPVF